jgi:glycerophosphoryl diester phosphodiesterase
MEKEVYNMNTIKIDNKKDVLMIAHRGMSGLEQENTNAAFIAAGNRTYYGIETDVHRTADGKFVLMHDANTKRTTGDDIEIGRATFETLRNMRVLDKCGKRSRTDLRIPTVDEYINICKHYEKTAVLELKDDFSTEEIDSICQIIEENEYMEHTVFISFKFNNLVLVKERMPEQSVQFLVWEKIDDELIEKLVEYHMDLDAKYDLYTEENIQKCHEKGIRVNAWTVDELEDAKRLIEWGIDYITSNILE